MQSLKKARARLTKKPKVAGRLRILSPDSLKASSDGRVFTTVTITDENQRDPSVAEPGIFQDVYAAEAKEGGRRGPNIGSHTDTTATAGMKLIYS